MSICNTISLFIQPIFIELLLCASIVLGSGDSTIKKNSLPSWSLYSSGMRRTINTLNDSVYSMLEGGIKQRLRVMVMVIGRGAEWATV